MTDGSLAEGGDRAGQATHPLAERRKDLDLGLHMANVADRMTMKAFESESADHEIKADGTPVTDADREVEASLRALLATDRSDDGFMGEETGVKPGRGRRWIVDPIDGTRNYIAQRKGWSTLIALEEEHNVTIGIASAPAIGCRWWGADAIGAYSRRHNAEAVSLLTSATSSMEEARWTCHPSRKLFRDHSPELADRLELCGRYVKPRFHPILMVAEGIVDLCVQLSGQPWDYAGFIGVVTAAGGTFSYLDGSTVLGPSRPALFTNGHVHDEVLHRLSG